MLQQPTQLGASIPQGSSQNGTFKPVTFRSGTGTSTSNANGMTTELNEPYSGLSGLVGQGTGLLGQAAQGAQQAPSQFNYNVNPNQRAQDLYSQRTALLEPQFAQQRAQGAESMFGAGRLGLRLAGQGVGAGNGMVQPDAFGMNQAQSQALAQTAAGASNDAFNQEQAMAGLQANQFGMNQQAKQQQYANLMGSGQGMLSAGMQGSALEQQMAQQQLQSQQLNQDYNLAQQNFGLASQGQAFNQGMSGQQLALAQQGQQFGQAQTQAELALAQQGQDFSQGMAQQQFGLAQQGQAQDYGLNEAQFNLASQGQTQNYGLAQQQQLQDYGIAQQNYGLSQQQQMQDYGLGQQKMDLATQQQLQDYQMGMLTNTQQYGLQKDGLAQNYELGTEQNRISAMAQLSAAAAAGNQPDPWLTGLVGAGSAFFGTEAGSGWLSNLFN